ncbi:hypothetical protein LTS18_002602, partial [Coniosporium uncinatum]
MNISQPVSSTITGIEFGFSTSDEIRAVSVKKITNPTTFDSLLHPVPGGLYDPAMGAFGDNPCTTCHLDRMRCPGHCGHIELPVAVYHPSFMDQCLRLMRATCVYCHHLKLPRVLVNKFCCKLRLIRHGLLKEAHDIDDITAGKSEGEEGEDDGSGADSDEGETNALIEKRNRFTRRVIREAVGERRSDWSLEKHEAVGDARRATVKEFLADITKAKKCGTCQGISPGYRKDR